MPHNLCQPTPTAFSHGQGWSEPVPACIWCEAEYAAGEVASLCMGRCERTDKHIHSHIQTRRRFRVSFTWPARLWAVGRGQSPHRKHARARWEHTNTQRDRINQIVSTELCSHYHWDKWRNARSHFLLWFQIRIIYFWALLLNRDWFLYMKHTTRWDLCEHFFF